MNSLLKFALISAVLMVFIYIPTLRYPFLQSWDDPEYITQNAHILALDGPNLKEIFTSFSMGNYAPVHILSYALDYRLFGPNPSGFRMTNLLIHFINSLLVFLIIRKVGENDWIAAAGGLLFAIHPLQVESVAWMSQRKNVLSALFLFLSFLSYAGYRETSRAGGYWISLLFFALGLLAKISIVVFPAYILCYDLLIAGKKISKKMFAEYVPFALLSLAAVAVTLKAQSVGGIRTEYYGESPWESILLVPTLWLTYLRQVIFPVGLSALYDEKIIASLSIIKIASVLIFLALMVWMVFGWIKGGRKIRLFWLSWSLAGLLPVSHLIPMVTVMNDRYLYFPVIGIFVLLGGALYELVRRAGSKTMKSAAYLLIILVVSSLAFSSSQRVKVWANDLTLWTDAVTKVPAQAKARNNLGTYYMSVNEDDKAVVEFKKALEINPNLYLGRLNLGATYLKMKNARSAVLELEKAVAIFDGDPKARYYLGMAHYLAGEYGLSVRELKWVVDRFPYWSEASLNLIRVYMDSGRKKEANTLIRSAESQFRHDINILGKLGRLKNSLNR